MTARIAKAVFLLPFNAVVIVPTVLLVLSGTSRWPEPWSSLAEGFGLIVFAAGFYGMVRTVALFARQGKGTLAPWDPPQRLVVRGPYRHVRNPMMSSVGAMVLGVALATNSLAVLTYFSVGVVLVPLLIMAFEEPQLAKRFGADYDEYRANVPAWIPRAKPWSPRAT